MQANGLPNTFLPGRHLLFLILGAAVAYRRGINAQVGGMCETDHPGYPDCRDATTRAMEQALRLGLHRPPLTVATPLMWLDNAATWRLAHSVGGDAPVRIVREGFARAALGRRRVEIWGQLWGQLAK
jgi:7-cyano-7-deazaguanine synthase